MAGKPLCVGRILAIRTLSGRKDGCWMNSRIVLRRKEASPTGSDGDSVGRVKDGGSCGLSDREDDGYVTAACCPAASRIFLGMIFASCRLYRKQVPTRALWPRLGVSLAVPRCSPYPALHPAWRRSWRRMAEMRGPYAESGRTRASQIIRQ